HLNHSARAQGDEIVVAHAQIAAIDFLVVLPDQWRRAGDPSRRLAESRDRTELQVFADHRMFHVDEGLAGFYLLAVHEFAHGVYRLNCDAPFFAFLVDLFFRVTATEFLYCPTHDLRIFTSE